MVTSCHRGNFGWVETRRLCRVIRVLPTHISDINVKYVRLVFKN